MKYGFLKTAAISPEIVVADPVSNLSAVLSAIDRASNEHVSLIVLPELCITGSSVGMLIHQTALYDAASGAYKTILEHTASSDAIVICGVSVRTNGSLYNCAAVSQRGNLLGLVPKCLEALRACGAERIFSPPAPRTVNVSYAGFSVPMGPELVFENSGEQDFRFGVYLGDPSKTGFATLHKLSECGCQLVAVLNDSPAMVGKTEQLHTTVKFLSQSLNATIVLCSPSCSESTTNCVMSALNIISENGDLLTESVPFGEGYCATETDIAFLNNERILAGFSSVSADCSVPFNFPENDPGELSRPVRRFPFLATTREERIRRTEEILNIQAYGLKKRLEHAHIRKVVLGVSGGLDSTLALLVSKKTMELLHRSAENIIAVTMPCFGTSKKTKDNAKRLCDALSIPLREIDISNSVAMHLSDIGHPLDVADTAFENAQARERTQVLMDISNMENGLVVGTGDLSELALGFATYNGDHMSMYAVNAGVCKTLMRDMLRNIADHTGGALAEVLNDIVETPVSPELLPTDNGEIAQITEDLIGPYELHDFFLYHLVRRNEAPEKILYLARHAFASLYTEETICKWLKVFLRRFFTQQFKRSCMPDGPKIGSVSLSPRGDWIMPSDASTGSFMDF